MRRTVFDRDNRTGRRLNDHNVDRRWTVDRWMRCIDMNKFETAFDLVDDNDHIYDPNEVRGLDVRPTHTFLYVTGPSVVSPFGAPADSSPYTPRDWLQDELDISYHEWRNLTHDDRIDLLAHARKAMRKAGLNVGHRRTRFDGDMLEDVEEEYIEEEVSRSRRNR